MRERESERERGIGKVQKRNNRMLLVYSIPYKPLNRLGKVYTVKKNQQNIDSKNYVAEINIKSKLN